MEAVWQERQETYPIAADVIDHGLEKLRDYRERIDVVPVYTLAMSTFLIYGILNRFVLMAFASPQSSTQLRNLSL